MSKKPTVFSENEQLAEKWRLGGGRGRVSPPPGAWFGGLGGFGTWFKAFTCLEARGLAGFIDVGVHSYIDVGIDISGVRYGGRPKTSFLSHK